MKLNTVQICIALLIYWAGLCNASAFYDSGAQRWLNRDPIEENGFEILRERNAVMVLIDGQSKDLYRFIDNSAINTVDWFGLAIIYSACSASEAAQCSALGYNGCLNWHNYGTLGNQYVEEWGTTCFHKDPPPPSASSCPPAKPPFWPPDLYRNNPPRLPPLDPAPPLKLPPFQRPPWWKN